MVENLAAAAEVKESAKVVAEGFKEIGSDKSMDLNEAKGFWDDQFSEMRDTEKAEETEASDVQENIVRETNDNEAINVDDSGDKNDSGEIIFINTRNQVLENQKHPITGVKFERKIIDLPNGERISGVFPNFDSMFDAYISEDKYLKSDKEQFKECNKQLYESIQSNPELKEKFSDEQIEQIKDGVDDGTAPDGYVWNHDAETGKLQLVDFDIHEKTGHTGGRHLWGGGDEYR